MILIDLYLCGFSMIVYNEKFSDIGLIQKGARCKSAWSITGIFDAADFNGPAYYSQLVFQREYGESSILLYISDIQSLYCHHLL
jgi:hypothetical protein